MANLFGSDTAGHEVLRQSGCKEFWGTSAGALMCAALAANYTPAQIEAMSVSPDFLQSVYAPMRPDAGKSPGAKTGYFKRHPNKEKRSLSEKTVGWIMDFETAAMELTMGASYNTADKTAFLAKVMSHTVDPEHPAAKAIPALADRSLDGFGDMNFSELHKRTGVHFNFVCQDRTTNNIVVITTRTDVPSERTLNGQKVLYVKGNEISITNATSASPTPRPLFDGPVEAGKFFVNDGGMTGHNNPVQLAIAQAVAEGVEPTDIRGVSIGVGKLEKDYRGPIARKAPMVYGSAAFDHFLEKEQTKRLAGACAAVPDAPTQLVNIAPCSPDVTRPFNYESSMVDREPSIGMMRDFAGDYFSGKVPNQKLNENVGHACYSDAVEAARKAYGLTEKAPGRSAKLSGRASPHAPKV
jgi:hypothetical protein